MEKKNLIILGIIIILIVIGVVFRLTKKTEEPIIHPLPELMQGEQIYNITGPENQRFKISQVIIDPLDVAIGKTQTVTVILEDLDKSDITEENRVTALALTDNHATEFSLEIAEVIAKEQALVVIWQGSWELEDSYNQNYRLTTRAFKEGDSDSVTITFR